MKFLTTHKFNYLHKTLLLSSMLIISPMVMAKPATNNSTLKLQQAEINNLKSQITQIQQQNQQKIDKLMAQLNKLEKLTQEEKNKLEKKTNKTKSPKKINKIKSVEKKNISKGNVEKAKSKPINKDKKPTKKPILLKTKKEQTIKNHLLKKIKDTSKSTPIKKGSVTKTKAKPVKKEDKSAKKTTVKIKKQVAKITPKKKKDTVIKKVKMQKDVKKKNKKVLGSDEISVEQLDLKKLLAGAKIETTQKPIKLVDTQIIDSKIETIVKSDDEPMLAKSKPNLLQVKKTDIKNTKPKQDNTSSELYLQALKAFSDKNTDVAIHKLKQYVNDYPNEKLVPKAKYWLGESYLQKEPADYATARYYFLEVVDKHEHHPQNNKQAKSLYRLSQLSKINNYDDELQKYADILEEKYPKSKENKLALELLKSE